ncbi:uncharacterized protein LOC129807024 isoform X5 [Phlebotomus papatasi]|uniref:uncharacterized protein LOC129807024 isoform X5 n=1 Tax=Phlebotomus papatasi TaxID=29031 RepID=UPI002483AE32|nr:uncharacterized protein LOC129807024 isoform X5 [Phlebotomus papatasi]
MDPPRKSNGMQKLYTKIIHKIEDFPPKIHAKLHKTSSKYHVQSSTPGGVSRQPKRYYHHHQQHQLVAAQQQVGGVSGSSDRRPERPLRRTKVSPRNYENVVVSRPYPQNGQCLSDRDDDEEAEVQIINPVLSLEDEIFEELEKVAHDEAKLNAVLQNFDKILADFNSHAQKEAKVVKVVQKDCKESTKVKEQTSKKDSKECIPKEKPSKIPQPPQGLQKSKTCSIIESRCILKKTPSDSGEFGDVDRLKINCSLDARLNLYNQATRSLWNLQDFEEFAKSGAESIKSETNLPEKCSESGNGKNYNTYKVKAGSKVGEKQLKSTASGLSKSVSQINQESKVIPKKIQQLDSVKAKAQFTRAKSVWELGNTPNNPNQLRRTISNSRIPVKMSLIPSPVKSGSETKIDSIPTKKVIKASPNGGSCQQLSTTAKVTAVVKCREKSNVESQTGAISKRLNVSTNALNRIGGKSGQKANGTIKGTNSEVALTKSVQQTRNQRKRETDVLLDKCLERGQAILKKVEAFGNATKYSSDSILASVRQFSEAERKGDVVDGIVMTSQARESLAKTAQLATVKRGINPANDAALIKRPTSGGGKIRATARDYTTVAGALGENKRDKSNSSSMEGHQLARNCETNGEIGKNSGKKQPMHFAQEKSVAFPRLESCKIIPPVLGPSQHAKVLVCMKTIQNLRDTLPPPPPPPVATPKVPEDAEKVTTEESTLDLGNEKEYQSDCSDDSGHISNENEEIIKTPPSTDSDAISQQPEDSLEIKGPTGRISEHLLEKFEPKGSKVVDDTKGGMIKVSEMNNWNLMKSTIPCRDQSSEVLFRSGVLGQLEAKRDELLSDRIIQFQSYCRGYLARRRVAQRRVQELAVRCIQRNVRAFLMVRDWPWWRLLVRVTPLLNVHRTEEQLKAANDELQTLKAKLDKIETERATLKAENEKLEAKLSEMTVDLAEERSTANLASERLEAEAAERLKLEKELQDQQGKIRTLQESSEKLEMELICAKSDLNGISEDEDGDNDDGAGGVYKLKYERVARELEFTKRRLQTQHEHDLEQLVGLKKQLEKKLADAYEEVEEQRQVVGQWKRKAQKMTNEMNDLRMLLDEQNSRNNLLEKRQRKFDSECQSLQEGARQEKQSKDRLAREKDILIAEKFTLEQNLADIRLELELKEEKLSSLQRELEEMTFGGGTEEEVAQLKRSKLELERRNKEQEEELDEMAGQVQLLEQAKLRLEMTLETMRKEARREAQQRDDELEEARGASYKKIKALECQLETEHEERTLLLREKHELERRLAAAAEQDRADRAAEESAIQKLKRDLRKYKALLKDAQSQLDRAKADSPGKVLIRQLRNQIEDAEAARTIAVKARQTAEAELTDLQSVLEETQRAKSEAEDKSTQAHRDRSELQAQIEENEEEMAELMKKYTATVKQLNTEQMASSEYEIKISELEAEKNSLKEQIAELTARVENVENMSDPSASLLSKRLELRTKELESKLELEQATKARVEVQCNRHKDALEKLQQEMSLVRAREMQYQESLKKTQKSLRELREELHTVSNREQESTVKRKDLEKRLEAAESECTSAKNDLRLALLRISDLQTAMEEGDEDPTDSDQDSDSSDDSLSDLEQRLNPIRPRLTSRIAAKETNGVADDALVIREGKSDNGPSFFLL